MRIGRIVSVGWLAACGLAAQAHAVALGDLVVGGIYCHDGFNDNNRVAVTGVFGLRAEVVFLEGERLDEVHRVPASELLPMSDCFAEAVVEGIDTIAATFAVLDALDRWLSQPPAPAPSDATALSPPPAPTPPPPAPRFESWLDVINDDGCFAQRNTAGAPLAPGAVDRLLASDRMNYVACPGQRELFMYVAHDAFLALDGRFGTPWGKAILHDDSLYLLENGTLHDLGSPLRFAQIADLARRSGSLIIAGTRDGKVQAGVELELLHSTSAKPVPARLPGTSVVFRNECAAAGELELTLLVDRPATKPVVVRLAPGVEHRSMLAALSLTAESARALLLWHARSAPGAPTPMVWNGPVAFADDPVGVSYHRLSGATTEDGQLLQVLGCP